MDTNCVPWWRIYSCFIMKRDFMMPLYDGERLILLMHLTLHPDILNINSIHFDNMVCQIYPAEIQLDNANTSDTDSK